MKVAEPSADDHERRIGDEIDGDDRLDLRGADAEIGADGRDRHIDDKGIDDEHELRRRHVHSTHQRRGSIAFACAASPAAAREAGRSQAWTLSATSTSDSS
jgi:hypothetical protein